MNVPRVEDLHQAVVWILQAPSFFNHPSAWDFPDEFSEGIVYDDLNDHLIQLQQTLEARPMRVGRVFEHLVRVIFEAHEEYNVLDSGVGIFEGKIQKTELDLLLRTPGGSGLHLEVAVKFYLLEEKNGENRIVGTDGKDAMEHRMSRFQKQLEEGLKYTRSRWPELKFEQGVFSRGRLFLPAFNREYDHSLIHPKAERGLWSTALPEPGDFILRDRWQWISWPPLQEQQEEWNGRREGDINAYRKGDPFPHRIYK